MKWAVKWQGYDTSDEMTWEPAGNLTNVQEDVDMFERRLASIPSMGAFTAAAGAAACCFGSVCKYPNDTSQAKKTCAVCAKTLHSVCASEHLFLKPFYGRLEPDVCFDCALLLAQVEKRTPFGATGGQLMFEPYYKQLGSTSALQPTPSGLGAMLATKSLKLIEPSAPAARPLPAVAKCRTCKSAEGELRACSFCKGVYHDTAACLGLERVAEASHTHKSFPWCCPKCFQRGKAALDKVLCAPANQGKRGR